MHHRTFRDTLINSGRVHARYLMFTVLGFYANSTKCQWSVNSTEYKHRYWNNIILCELNPVSSTWLTSWVDKWNMTFTGQFYIMRWQWRKHVEVAWCILGRFVILIKLSDNYSPCWNIQAGLDDLGSSSENGKGDRCPEAGLVHPEHYRSCHPR